MQGWYRENICTEEKMKAQVEETTDCEKGRSRNGRETFNISSFLLKTKWNPPLIGLAEVAVCVCQCVFVGKYLFVSWCIITAAVFWPCSPSGLLFSSGITEICTVGRLLLTLNYMSTLFYFIPETKHIQHTLSPGLHITCRCSSVTSQILTVNCHTAYVSETENTGLRDDAF